MDLASAGLGLELELGLVWAVVSGNHLNFTLVNFYCLEGILGFYVVVLYQ
jgi:hypothetical protein